MIRGVKLTVIQSNAGTDPAHDYGTVSATNAYTALVRKLKNDMADQHFMPADGSSIDDDICSHVAYTPLRYSQYWDLWPDSNDKIQVHGCQPYEGGDCGPLGVLPGVA